MEYSITQLSNHSSHYRGFVITRLPRKKAVQPITRYQVSQGDLNYGKFDAQAEATNHIDNLYRMHGL